MKQKCNLPYCKNKADYLFRFKKEILICCNKHAIEMFYLIDKKPEIKQSLKYSMPI